MKNNTIEKSKVYFGDCIENLRSFDDKYFDIAICDPPYGIDIGNMPFLKENMSFVNQRNGKKSFIKKDYTLKDWDKQTPSQLYFNEVQRVSKNQIIFGIDYMNWENVGPGRIKWNKGVPDKVSFNQFEVAYCSFIEQEIEVKYLWSGYRQGKSILEPMVQQGNKKLNEKRIHPCQKPVLLYKILLTKFGFQNCKVIDTHVGSGSIRIAFEELGCEFVGFENDFEYFKKQELRWNQYKSQLKLNL